MIGIEIENLCLNLDFVPNVNPLYPKLNQKKQRYAHYVLWKSIRIDIEKGRKTPVPCRICKKSEKGADTESIYICSTCVGIIGSMQRADVRDVIDKLYLANRSEDAQFVEKIVSGTNNNSSETPKLLKRTIPIKVRVRK